MVGTRSCAIRRSPSRSSFSASPMAAYACPADMAFIRLFASIDVPRRIARERVLRSASLPLGVDLTPYVDAHGRPPDRKRLQSSIGFQPVGVTPLSANLSVSAYRGDTQDAYATRLETKEGICRDYRLPSVWHDDSSEIDALAGRIHACELFSARNRQSPQAPPRGAFHGR
jgi:hypothetical protein